ncbi:MAG: hypothetical protein SGJ19_02625 [Planctomycetia bacterium]|nr:hypothetical protein [Planctomycetia bacterium]
MTEHQFPLRESSGESNRIVLGVFGDAANVDAALHDLRKANFTAHQLGVMARADANEWTPPSSISEPESTVETSAETSVADGAIAGVGLGSLWALGIAAGMLPAIGPIIAGGMLGSVLASAVAGAATGGLAGGLIGLGLSEPEVQFFVQELSAGQMLLTVQAGRRAIEALAILHRHGARDLESG